MYSQEGLLDLEKEKYVVSIFYLGRAQPLLLFPAFFFFLKEFLYFYYLFILFLAVLGLRFCARALL